MALQAQINKPTPRSTPGQDKPQEADMSAGHPRAQLQENHVKPLSDRDRDIFLAWMESDTEPNEALVEAARRFTQEGL